MRLSEKIRFQVPILNLAAKLELTASGERADCPFCGATRAMLLDATENRFRCEACSRQGSQIDLVRQVRRAGYEEAVDWLRQTYGLKDDAQTDALLDSWRREVRKPSLDSLFGAPTQRPRAGDADSDEAIYEEVLKAAPFGEPAASFLERRGYPKPLIAELGIGWIGSPAELCERLDGQFGRERLRAAGLITPLSTFLFNEHRLVVPFNVSGRPRFLRARRLDGQKPEWASLVRKRAPIFPHQRLSRLKPGDRVYLAPDLPDALALLMRGLAAFALLGFETRAPEALEPFLAYEVVLCGEPDEQGKAFNRAMASHFDALRKDVRTGDLPPGFGDWNEFRLFKRS
jgi:hypothetical protein